MKDMWLKIGDTTARMEVLASETPGVTYRITLQTLPGLYPTSTLNAERIRVGCAPVLLPDAAITKIVTVVGEGKRNEVTGWELTISSPTQLSQTTKAFMLAFLLQNTDCREISRSKSTAPA